MDSRTLVQSWLDGRARAANGRVALAPSRDEPVARKLRRAYRWISENAILSPYVDIEFGTPLRLEHGEHRVELYDRPGYSSFILMPLLTLVTGRRLVFLGAPGRGKTSVAVLMALLAGHPFDAVRRAVQHGHPQLTIADLLGGPVPSELIRAQDAKDIRVAWRDWITMRVKVIDEYNRIPTKTQSALLSLMAEGYAEMYEQVVLSGRSAWYLTANDELGGGTFPVIEALKDRIDVVVRCTPFHAQHLDVLARRIASAQDAEEFVPRDIILSEEELAAADREIRATRLPGDVLAVLGFLLGQLDFCRRASDRLEFMNKDTLHLAGRRVGHVCTEDCPLDKHENLCTQSENGVSPRAYQAVIHFAKALAWFRGEAAVSTDDMRQLLPWVLFEKLRPNPQSAFFQKTENKWLLTDRASWVRQLFDRAVQQWTAYQPRRRPVLALCEEAAAVEFDRLAAATIRERITRVQQTMQELLSKHELNGPVYDDLVRLGALHAGYQRWLDGR
jgi:MoxR-like ATPase